MTTGAEVKTISALTIYNSVVERPVVNWARVFRVVRPVKATTLLHLSSSHYPEKRMFRLFYPGTRISSAIETTWGGTFREQGVLRNVLDTLYS